MCVNKFRTRYLILQKWLIKYPSEQLNILYNWKTGNAPEIHKHAGLFIQYPLILRLSTKLLNLITSNIIIQMQSFSLYDNYHNLYAFGIVEHVNKLLQV